MRTSVYAAILLATFATSGARAAQPERTVQNAATVLNDIMAVPVARIPEALLADAEAVAVFPGVVKVGFVAGVEHGRGVVTIRQEDRNWGAPRFITVTGGSVGWQIGASATDLILVFKTRKSVDNLLEGKFKIGADIAAAAGPVGRRAEAATDGQLQAEIYSYSRSRGLFAGASIDGAVIAIDSQAEAAYYRAGLDGKAILPDSATLFVGTVAKYSTSSRILAPGEVLEQQPMPMVAVDPLETLRKDLANSSDQLTAVLDDTWKRFLALPADVYAENGKPSAAAMNSAIQRYEQVARDPKYAALAKRPEFQRVRASLQQFASAVEAEPSAVLALPPPPANGQKPAPRNTLPR
jgi:lipid-binding SYLF domain-containing protein